MLHLTQAWGCLSNPRPLELWHRRKGEYNWNEISASNVASAEEEAITIFSARHFLALSFYSMEPKSLSWVKRTVERFLGVAAVTCDHTQDTALQHPAPNSDRQGPTPSLVT